MPHLWDKLLRRPSFENDIDYKYLQFWKHRIVFLFAWWTQYALEYTCNLQVGVGVGGRMGGRMGGGGGGGVGGVGGGGGGAGGVGVGGGGGGIWDFIHTGGLIDI